MGETDRAEYINKKKLVFDLLAMAKHQSEDRRRAFFDIIDFVKFVRASDAAEIRRGCWMYDEAEKRYFCSECGSFIDKKTFNSNTFQKDFCGHCGATMDRKER